MVLAGRRCDLRKFIDTRIPSLFKEKRKFLVGKSAENLRDSLLKPKIATLPCSSLNTRVEFK